LDASSTGTAEGDRGFEPPSTPSAWVWGQQSDFDGGRPTGNVGWDFAVSSQFSAIEKLSATDRRACGGRAPEGVASYPDNAPLSKQFYHVPRNWPLPIIDDVCGPGQKEPAQVDMNVQERPPAQCRARIPTAVLGRRNLTVLPKRAGASLIRSTLLSVFGAILNAACGDPVLNTMSSERRLTSKRLGC